jgi:hypothetical protein
VADVDARRVVAGAAAPAASALLLMTIPGVAELLGLTIAS